MRAKNLSFIGQSICLFICFHLLHGSNLVMELNDKVCQKLGCQGPPVMC